MSNRPLSVIDREAILGAPREIITLNIGQAGVHLGASILEMLCLEHDISKNGERRPKSDEGGQSQSGFLSFFDETENGTYYPRSLFIDLDFGPVHEMKCGDYGQMLKSSQLVTGKEDSANNFARGRYTVGQDFLPEVFEAIRKTVESCQSLQGFILTHSMGGGCGSGLTSVIMEQLLCDYGDKISRVNFAVMPSEASSCVVEPLNGVLSSTYLLEHSDVCCLFDNAALGRICRQVLEIERPSYQNLNRLISHIFSATTMSIRFGGTLNVDLTDLQVNLVPYPRVHFLLSSLAPIQRTEIAFHDGYSTAEITEALFRPDRMFLDCNTDHGKYMSVCVMYRGEVASNEIPQAITSVKSKVQFVDWCPTGFKVSANKSKSPAIPNSELPSFLRSAAMIANTTSISIAFQNMAEKFDLMYSRRAFVHWYVGEGMEEGEFAEAREDLLALENDYELCAAETTVDQ
jgi:tubulin alpha